ncbi:chemotaxis protein CheC [Marinilactibacillus psychrotolerans]|uniref:Chemotaxis protein, CheC n=1 Tax=Marinilactibacillus psychrotolerans TaxID=191770 RepID=A0AAV3WU01_9LACT|nr:chemotaxis protein CheC [Marinilactibacillus psychrotolerans]GEL67372.1 CheY-P-specific phosphatase CheC [Marinilactibacillus psychrotolerans]GEQ36315.1 chemotaxis protein, CheC [Marinilactibacillus psychrotolerans]SDC95019.1 chemotaxis protein CheC [Marinilactibacillus psychrotolerans]
MTQDGHLFRLDALQEIINIGGGNAATSLSKLIERKVEMEVPTLEIMEYDQIYQKIRKEDEVVKAVLMNLIGDEEYGVFLFVVNPKNAEKLAQMITPSGVELTNELIDSAVSEIVNILVHSFMTAIMKIIAIKMVSTVPIMAEDMFGSIISSVYMEQEQYDQQILIIKNEYYSLGHKIEGSLYFVPKPGVLELLLQQLGL